MFIPRLKKKHRLIAPAIGFICCFILILRLYYVQYAIDVFQHSLDDTRTHSYKYLINESEICKPFPEKIFLLIAVPSKTSGFEERRVIRKTWGSLAVNNTEIRLVFMLGYRSEINHHDLKIESENYHDIIQEDFYDSYRNLSIKSEAILRFASTFCQGVKYVLKVDVDVFINLPALIEDLRKHDRRNMIMGYRHSFAKPVRNPKLKWYTDGIAYPLAHYPNYASGRAYVISGDITSKLLSVALQTKYNSVEDVFINGIVRERAAVKLVHRRDFGYSDPSVDICWFENQIAGQPYTKEQMIEIWSEKVQNKHCTWLLRLYYMLYDLFVRD
ncbi:beta-1,3-galactosyltransferase 2 [Patella vulgata]|uniref:beta-1,3-galactosyltransferase 2 n=1 Tax=Patella vulgata TaxID=6465 RepID=UPI00217FAE43|nr:beta-1,3-galactosyltransferase 2 [Patella vulgata]XP_050408092.1 beta-1,3-galactosyltransferase 2 [Patella vulgata]